MVFGEFVPWMSKPGLSSSSARAPSRLPGRPVDASSASAPWMFVPGVFQSGHSSLLVMRKKLPPLQALLCNADAVAARRIVRIDQIEKAVFPINHNRARNDGSAVEHHLSLKRERQAFPRGT